MPLPSALTAFHDCETLFQAAAAHPHGARMPISRGSQTPLDAFVFRMQHYRRLLRRESRRIYSSDHPLWDKSEFDYLAIRKEHDPEKDIYWCRVEPHGQRALLAFIEPLPDPTTGQIPTYSPPQLTYDITHAPNTPPDDFDPDTETLS